MKIDKLIKQLRDQVAKDDPVYAQWQDMCQIMQEASQFVGQGFAKYERMVDHEMKLRGVKADLSGSPLVCVCPKMFCLSELSQAYLASAIPASLHTEEFSKKCETLAKDITKRRELVALRVKDVLENCDALNVQSVDFTELPIFQSETLELPKVSLLYTQHQLQWALLDLQLQKALTLTERQVEALVQERVDLIMQAHDSRIELEYIEFGLKTKHAWHTQAISTMRNRLCQDGFHQNVNLFWQDQLLESYPSHDRLLFQAQEKPDAAPILDAEQAIQAHTHRQEPNPGRRPSTSSSQAPNRPDPGRRPSTSSSLSDETALDDPPSSLAEAPSPSRKPPNKLLAVSFPRRPIGMSILCADHDNNTGMIVGNVISGSLADSLGVEAGLTGLSIQGESILESDFDSIQAMICGTHLPLEMEFLDLREPESEPEDKKPARKSYFPTLPKFMEKNQDDSVHS